MTPKGLNVLITGASAGLGAALAREHARQGHSLILVARRGALLRALEPELRTLGAVAVVTHAGDVCRRADLDRLVKSALGRLGSIDVVYANAGFGRSGTLASLNLSLWRRQQAVNVEGVLNTVWACLPALKASQGRLGLVGSVLGFGSVPGNGAYVASKFAVRALAQTLRLELGPLGISVTHIAPGFFDSEFRQRDLAGRYDPRVPDSAPAGLSISAAEAARRASQAVLKRRREIVFPLFGRLVAALFQHMPGLALRLAAWVQRRRKGA